MPGYDRNRFDPYYHNCRVDLDQFTCGICHGIFIRPVVTDCCRQTYCSDCINEWLVNRNTCPNDRNYLTRNRLREMPRAFINLLQNLVIKCNYVLEGCEEKVKLSELDRHIKDCPYKPNVVCNLCGNVGENASKHNCIESLLKEKNVLEEKVKQMSIEYEVKALIIKKTLTRIRNNFETEIDKIKNKNIRELKDLTVSDK